MMEMETDLFDLGVCGDVLRVNMVIWEIKLQRIFVLLNLGLKLSLLLEDGSFLV